MTILDGTYYGTLENDLWQLSLDVPVGYGRTGSDTLYGSNIRNKLYGNRGNDTLFGNGGRDSLFGGYGFDTLYGGSGNDEIIGGAGNDYLVGYGINSGIEPEFNFDLLQGDAGADTFVLGEDFVFYANPATDEQAVIVDFIRAEGDKIQVVGSASDYSLVGGFFDGNSFGVNEIRYQGNLIATVDSLNNLDLQLDFNFV